MPIRSHVVNLDNLRLTFSANSDKAFTIISWPRERYSTQLLHILGVLTDNIWTLIRNVCLIVLELRLELSYFILTHLECGRSAIH